MRLLFQITPVVACLVLSFFFIKDKRNTSFGISDLYYALFFLLITVLLFFAEKIIRKYKLQLVESKSATLLSFILISFLSITFFIFLPEIIYDDAAIILRYMDHFGNHEWFKYNTSDLAVYGISGFLHGLFSGFLAYTGLFSSEQALWVSNITGFIFTSWFTYLICKKLITSFKLQIIAWFVLISCASNFLYVASSGLETSLHLAFVTGAIYFLFVDRKSWFFFFSALMILSKLDAVPVATSLFLYFLIANPTVLIQKKQRLSELKLFSKWFLFPLAVGMAVIIFLFGSPLPQSAFAKLYFHGHPADHWFPFLKYFTTTPLMLTLLTGAGIFWVAGVVEFAVKKDRNSLINSLPGTLFIFVMMLYYFYNPGEQMLWYYAMPEFFLLMQLVTGICHFSTQYPFLVVHKKTTIPFLYFFMFCCISWSNTIYIFTQLKNSSHFAEGERKYIGQFIGNSSSASDTLLSGHGLIARYFKGYVIDVSGLNSTLATDYHLNADSIITSLKPSFIVNHAFRQVAVLTRKHPYKLMNLYRNINDQGYNSWIVLKRTGNELKSEIGFLDTNLNKKYISAQRYIPALKSINNSISIIDTSDQPFTKIHLGIDRTYLNQQFSFELYKKGVFIRTEKPFIDSAANYDIKIFNVTVNFSQADSIAIKSASNKPFEILDPLFEFSTGK